MPTMTKLIHDRHLLRLIPLLLKYLHISRQGCRVAAHVDDTFRRHMDQSVQKYLIAALSRWIHDNNVCMGTVAAFFVYVGNDFLCLANEELGICDPVDLGVVSCIIYSLWNDLHSVYLLCLLCEEQGYGSYSAVHVPHGLVTGQVRILQSLVVQDICLDRIYLIEGQWGYLESFSVSGAHEHTYSCSVHLSFICT